MAVSIKTGRGDYLLKTAAPDQRDANVILLTLALERRDGIERVAFRCRLAAGLVDPTSDAEVIMCRLAPWLEREFEMTRESALKTIRSEHRLLEISFDASNRGPF
ncbi:MAG: hypothetical protein JO121_03130 [Deltaproteobacteria bacterium]|nr:hypothetical protein [Deltaproteobacteria bacterium]